MASNNLINYYFNGGERSIDHLGVFNGEGQIQATLCGILIFPNEARTWSEGKSNCFECILVAETLCLHCQRRQMDVPTGIGPGGSPAFRNGGYCVECLKGAFSRGYTCGSNPNYTCHYDAGKCRTCAPSPDDVMREVWWAGRRLSLQHSRARKIERDRIVSAFLA